MEKRDVNITFAKSGNGIGAKLTVPMPWLREMGVTPESKEIELIFNEETKEITIRKR